MTGWSCPNCGYDGVCSRQEWVVAYDYRGRIATYGPRMLATSLSGYGVQPTAVEDAMDLCLRWAEGDTDGPEYVCPRCVTPFSGREVPA